MPDAWIFDTVRTPRGRGRPDGSLYTVRPLDLLITVLRALKQRNDLDTGALDDVMMGCVTQVGEQGACPARFAVLEAGYEQHVPAVTLNRFCASGLDAVNQAACAVMAGMAELVVAGGVEHMSRVPMGSDGGPWWDAAGQWAYGSVPQGISADLLATLHQVDRQAVDRYAVASQQRAARAWDEGVFHGSVVPVHDPGGRVLLQRDEHLRPDTSLEALARLDPSFRVMGEQYALDSLTRRKYPQVDRIRHVHHAGNSSGIVDGAAAVLVGTREKGEALGLEPRARIRGMAVAGAEPLIMLDAPMPASRKALRRAGMDTADIDLFEVNEAFAVVPILYMRDLDLSHDRVNVDGGAIALGHPLGATGAVLLGSLLDSLAARDLHTGLVTLCAGGGMGIATVIERA